MKSVSARVLAVVAVLSLLANVLLYLRYSSGRPLVTVGSEVITKKQYQDQLEHQAGADVLSKMVLTKLVMQAAAQAGVTPTDQDVKNELASIERRSPQVLSPFVQDAQKMAEFQTDLTTKMALENLQIKDVALTPAEVAAYYSRHQADFKLPQQIQTITVVTQNPVDASTAADLLRQNERPDAIGRQPRMGVIGINGYNPDLSALPPAFKQQISKGIQAMKTGEVRTFHGGPWYLSMRVSKNNNAALPPLSQVQEQVEHQARLEKAPSALKTMARLYQTAKPTFHYDPEKYQAYFNAIQNYPLDNDSGKKTARVP